MYSVWATYLVTLGAVIGITIAEPSLSRRAVAHLISENVTGSIFFTETDEGVRVTGTILGKQPGLYGFHVHELGDTLDCLSTGAHFNPDGTNHGGRNHTVRHVGDLGNVYADQLSASLNLVDSSISLRGRNNILGRGLVLHAGEDDLGLGGDEESLRTGNAGPRVACAVIGMAAPVDAWYYENSSSNVVPSMFLALFSVLFTTRYL